MSKVRATLVKFGRGILHRLRHERGDWMTYINWAIGIGAAILVGAATYKVVIPAINSGLSGQTNCFFGSGTGSVSTSCQTPSSS